MFALAAGSQINQDKSLTIWVSQEPKLFTWGTEENLRWLGPSETTQYLGFEIELQISLAVCFEKARSKLKQKFAYWATKLSLGSRVLIANQILLASTSFIGSYWSLDRNAILKV